MLTASSTAPYFSKPSRRVASVVCQASPLSRLLVAPSEGYGKVSVKAWTYPTNSFAMSRFERVISLRFSLRLEKKK